MRKNIVVLLIIVTCILVVAGCPGKPPPLKPDPVTGPGTGTSTGTTTTPSTGTSTGTATTPTVPQSKDLILDNATNYVVVRGDTLSGIAAVKYGGSNMFFFPLIRLGNANIVPDAEVIEVGTNLVIPDLQKNLNNAGAKALLREDMLSIARQYERINRPNSAAILKRLANRL